MHISLSDFSSHVIKNRTTWLGEKGAFDWKHIISNVSVALSQPGALAESGRRAVIHLNHEGRFTLTTN